MFENPSLLTRIIIGKSIGFLIGLCGFISLPYVMPEAGMMLRFGILFWYTTLGLIIAIFGVFNWHPILKIPMPWWFRASFMGGWMNFVLVLFAYDIMAEFLAAAFGPQGLLASPFWFVVEGAIVGLVIGFFATRYGGEGPETVRQ